MAVSRSHKIVAKVERKRCVLPAERLLQRREFKIKVENTLSISAFLGQSAFAVTYFTSLRSECQWNGFSLGLTLVPLYNILGIPQCKKNKKHRHVW